MEQSERCGRRPRARHAPRRRSVECPQYGLCGELLLGVLRVVDDEVCAVAQLEHSPIDLRPVFGLLVVAHERN